ITLGIQKNKLLIKAETIQTQPQLVINRSRDSFLAKHLELMGIKVYNAYRVSSICNDKASTHQMAHTLGIVSLDTLFLDKTCFDINHLDITYPVILKSVSGHGGEEVFKCMNKEDIIAYLHQITDNHFLIQQMNDRPGIDIRIFAIGKTIIGAIKRESKTDFRSNYSLGGQASLYHLTEQNEKLVKRILAYLKSDFVGIDFMLNQKGEFVFNEIEDVVGSRTLYEYARIDTAKAYIEYIAGDKNRL
ncbi:MAG: hypothetical protein K0S30_1552, partial [Clostridia bacterium]|nr:hypothetical protein [Clostridia bacterium]